MVNHEEVGHIVGVELLAVSSDEGHRLGDGHLVAKRYELRGHQAARRVVIVLEQRRDILRLVHVLQRPGRHLLRKMPENVGGHVRARLIEDAG